MYKLSLEEVMYIHSEAIKSSGGRNGIRDMGLLESAVNAPFQSFGGHDVYSTIYHKAARLALGLAHNHAFIDGNKRVSALAMLIFLKGNNIEIDCTELELFSLFYELAASEITFDDLVARIMKHEVPRHF